MPRASILALALLGGCAAEYGAADNPTRVIDSSGSTFGWSTPTMLAPVSQHIDALVASSCPGAQPSDPCTLPDECLAATACSGAEVCRCREAASDANACVMGNCVVDSDCGAGGYCSPSRAFDRINFGVAGYWCHTASDECVDDVDCNPDGGSAA